MKLNQKKLTKIINTLISITLDETKPPNIRLEAAKLLLELRERP